MTSSTDHAHRVDGENDAFRTTLRQATPLQAAHAVLGGVLSSGGVQLKIVEVEAYGAGPDSPFPDPAAHTYRGRTARNDVMFGDAGHLYVYLSHGIHHCTNIVYGPEGQGGGVLLRAAEIVSGYEDIARRRAARRSTPIARFQLARGPGNLGACLGVALADGGIDLLHSRSPITFQPHSISPELISAGPRVGVSQAADRPWRWWITGSPAVSAFRRSPRAAPAGTDLHDNPVDGTTANASTG